LTETETLVEICIVSVVVKADILVEMVIFLFDMHNEFTEIACYLSRHKSSKICYA